MVQQMDLRDWQSRLEQHFGALRARRSADAGEQPIFALEHGLDEQEVGEVAEAVRAHILDSAPRWEHRLPWVVYAAELGYLYSGDEYWQSFEARTPGWLVHGDRHWIRRCFRDFQQRYGGAEPTGPWARHFSIICWPITHAILPQDLQRQLAEILFKLRHALTSDALSTPRRLGELVAGRSWGTSSRFQQLAQEPLLIGQIAAALLLQGERRAPSLILPATLSRIGQDLDRERRARAWMRGARETAQRNVHFQRGLGTVRGPRAQGEDDEEGVRRQGGLGVEPRLVLRPAGEGRWDVVLEVPDFSHVPARFPSLREPLTNSRCRITGSSGRWKPGTWLLYGRRSVSLKEWPPVDQPLLEFESSTPELDYLLRTECFLRPGPTWLFKVASDGLAYEVRAAHARAGSKYVLVSREEVTAAAPPFVTPTALVCEGVSGLLLDLPDALTPELSDVLDSIGVPRAGMIEIWPAGLVPARWDGDGHAEWLSTETPCVGVRADHHVEAFVAELGPEVVVVEPERPGDPVFIELPWLGVGQHTLRVSARGPGDELSSAPGVLDIQIRDPRVWVPGSSSQSALLVVIDPSAPTLEQLWEGDVDIEVHGPRGRQVDCRIAFYEKGETLPHFERTLPALRIPVTANAWRVFIDNQVKDDRNIQNAYDLAHAGEVQFHAGELGAFTLAAEREFAPLRWAVRRTRQAFHLRAIDDTGEEGAVEVRLYEFDAPDMGRQLDSASFCAGTGAEARGGLYVATAGGHRRAIIILPKVRTFADLRIEPRLMARKRTPSDVIALLRLLELWAGARLTGSLFFSRTMRRRVLEFMLDEVFRLIGGDRWAAAARRLDSNSGEEAAQEAKRAISHRREEAGLGSVVARDAKELAAMSPEERARRLADLGQRFLGMSQPRNRPDRLRGVERRGAVTLIRNRPDGPTHPAWLSEFALRLASCPAGLIEWAGENLEDATKRLLEVPALARGARYMVFAIRRVGVPQGAEGGLLCDGWEWQ